MCKSFHNKNTYLCGLLLSCTQLFCDPMDCSLPGSSVHGISQARILKWVASLLLQGICPTQGSNPRLLHCQANSFNTEPPGKPQNIFTLSIKPHSEGHLVGWCMRLQSHKPSASPVAWCFQSVPWFNFAKLICIVGSANPEMKKNSLGSPAPSCNRSGMWTLFLLVRDCWSS